MYEKENMIMIGIMVIIVGLIYLIFPEIGWMLTSYGNGTSKIGRNPSYGELVFYRISGVPMIIFGVLMFYFI
jgi:uncharacterized membrane protein HdeD (DUF308 family)